MGKKKRTFADKVRKSSAPKGEVCSVCGEEKKLIKVVAAFRTEDGKSYKFSEKMVSVCKCNRDVVFG